MKSKLLSLFGGGMKACKVQDVRRDKRVGVTASTFKDLVKKGCEKLQLESDGVTVVLLDDGTEVDDDQFFMKLPDHTVFVFLEKGEKWAGAYDALSKLYNLPEKAELANQIRDMLTSEDAPEKVHIMTQYLEMYETNTDAEKRHDDEDWFEGLNKKYKCKTDVMRHSAETRLRSYLNTAKEQINKESDAASKILLKDTLTELLSRLKKNQYHGGYFDRTHKQAMCDKVGWFQCEGPFDLDKCEARHTINPYASRGNRQMWALWNLDHIIEKSREILPTLIEAARTKKSSQTINTDHVYKLLFTRTNLKLVQIGCHKKAARSQTCNIEDFLTG